MSTTKYALTQGIFETEAEPCKERHICCHKEGMFHTYYRKLYWHETKEEAIIHAKELQQKMLKSLEKKIKTISKLEFK